MFTDTITVKCEAGKGGNGVVAWRREKYIPKGGPMGGNGGKGGDVIIQGDENIFSLDWYRNNRILNAKRGGQGGSNRQQGRRGDPLVLKVPCGTIVRDCNTNQVLFDVTDTKSKHLLCEGGRGGRGNASFKSSINRAPHFCTEGKEGTAFEVEMTLKIIADIGLVGFPNAGKSTLINLLTKAKAKCGDYPFTTLIPNIGFIETEDYRRFIIADIPGIIEGAHQNKGLGLQFLKHIERSKVLFFMLDASQDIAEHYQILCSEIRAHNPKILEKPTLLLLNKCDLNVSREHIDQFKKEAQATVVEISAKSGYGKEELILSFTQLMSQAQPACL